MQNKVTYRQQFTRCGKQRCRKCKEGAGHGPYWYAYWSENGRTISKYIGIHPPSDLKITTNEASNRLPSIEEAEVAFAGGSGDELNLALLDLLAIMGVFRNACEHGEIGLEDFCPMCDRA